VEAEAVKFLWKLKHFEERSWSKLGSIWLFKESEAEPFFIKHGAGMWKRLNFCGSGSTLKKEANPEAFDFLRSRKHFS